MNREPVTKDCINAGLIERLKQLMYQAIDEHDRELIDMDRITAETELATLPLDSLATIALIYEIEQAFDIAVLEEQAFEFQVVGDVVAYVQAHMLPNTGSGRGAAIDA